MIPTLWTYKLDRGWYAHIDWHDHKPLKKEGPFVSEAQAVIVISRMNGMEPPEEVIKEREWEINYDQSYCL